MQNEGTRVVTLRCPKCLQSVTVGAAQAKNELNCGACLLEDTQIVRLEVVALLPLGEAAPKVDATLKCGECNFTGKTPADFVAHVWNEHTP